MGYIPWYYSEDFFKQGAQIIRSHTLPNSGMTFWCLVNDVPTFMVRSGRKLMLPVNVGDTVKIAAFNGNQPRRGNAFRALSAYFAGTPAVEGGQTEPEDWPNESKIEVRPWDMRTIHGLMVPQMGVSRYVVVTTLGEGGDGIAESKWGTAVARRIGADMLCYVYKPGLARRKPQPVFYGEGYLSASEQETVYRERDYCLKGEVRRSDVRSGGTESKSPAGPTGSNYGDIRYGGAVLGAGDVFQDYFQPPTMIYGSAVEPEYLHVQAMLWRDITDHFKVWARGWNSHYVTFPPGFYIGDNFFWVPGGGGYSGGSSILDLPHVPRR